MNSVCTAILTWADLRTIHHNRSTLTEVSIHVIEKDSMLQALKEEFCVCMRFVNTPHLACDSMCSKHSVLHVAT